MTFGTPSLRSSMMKIKNMRLFALAIATGGVGVILRLCRCAKWTGGGGLALRGGGSATSGLCRGHAPRLSIPVR